MSEVRRAVLALGANLGDRYAALQAAVRALDGTDRLEVTAVSPVYETAAVGPPQPDFLNAVVLADTDLPAVALLARAHQVEDATGRVRTERWGPRTLDVDLLAVGDEVRDSAELTLPHPRAHERVFVLAPWADLAPDDVLPGRGTVAALLADLRRALPPGAVRPRPDLALPVP